MNPSLIGACIASWGCRVASDGCSRRKNVRGSRSPKRADGAAVALRLVLMSCFLCLPDYAPLASYRWGSPVRAVIYGRALGEIKEVVAKSRRNQDEYALHSGSDRTRGRKRHFGTGDKSEKGGGGPTRIRRRSGIA